MKTRWISFAMALAMCLTLVPSGVFAAEQEKFLPPEAPTAAQEQDQLEEHTHDEYTAMGNATQLRYWINGNNPSSVYLNADIELDTALVISGSKTVNLCLNGHDLKLKDGVTDSVIKIESGATLNLYDCSTARTRYGQWTVGNDNSLGTADDIFSIDTLEPSGKKEGKDYLKLTGGCICGGKYNKGGGVYNGGTFNMYGGNIAENMATGSAPVDGGGGVFNDGTFNMYGGNIAGNTATGTVGGGVYVSSDAFTMVGGSISCNKAATNGGGVYNGSLGTFTMTGGTISNNTANTNGGGVYNDGTFKLSEDLIITGNTSGAVEFRKADNVFLPNKKKITITGNLTTGANIGVSTETTPTVNSFVVFAEGAKTPPYTIENGDKSLFAPDNSDYAIVLAEEQLKLAARPEAPEISIDYHNEKLTGFDSSSSYTIDGKDVTPVDGELAIDNSYFGKTIPIVKKGDGTAALDSVAQCLAIPARPAAPTGQKIDYTAETFTEVSNLLQYKVSEGEWTSCTGESLDLNDIIGVSEKAISFRKAAVTEGDPKAFASEAGTAIPIPGRPGEPDVTLEQTHKKFTGLTTDMEYSTDGGSNWTACTTELTFAAVGWTGPSAVTVLFRTKATNEAFAGKEKELTIPAVETPPSGGGSDDGNSYDDDSYRPEPRPDPKPEPSKPPVVPDLKPGETTTETRPDGTRVEASKDQEGNTTVTETKPDGTVIQAEEKANGDKSVTEIKPDGSSIKSEERANGDKLTTKTDPEGASVSKGKKTDGTTAKVETDADGKTKAEVKVTEEAAEQAQKEQKPVELPLPPVVAEKEPEKAPKVKIELHTDSVEIKVSIPVKKPTAGTVAVLVKPDGTEQVLPKSMVDEKGLTLEVGSGATVKIVDNSKAFQDVHPVHHWATEAVDFVSSREIFNGTGRDVFNPNLSTSRGMITRVLYNMESQPDYTVQNDFDDVDDGKWYTDAVNWAAENDVINGYSNGSFGPDDMITREQLAAMLYRYADRPDHEADAAKTFNDANQISKYAREAMDWAVENGIIKGIGKNLMNPKGLTTRAESAAMITRFMQLQ